MEFVSKEIAEKLKKAGFKEKCFAFYAPDTSKLNYNYSSVTNNTFNGCLYSHNSLNQKEVTSDFIDAPTINEVLEWLRNKKNIYIQISKSWAMNNSCYFFVEKGDGEDGSDYQQMSEPNRSWNQATIDGINYALDNMIEPEQTEKEILFKDLKAGNYIYHVIPLSNEQQILNCRITGIEEINDDIIKFNTDTYSVFIPKVDLDKDRFSCYFTNKKYAKGYFIRKAKDIIDDFSREISDLTQKVNLIADKKCNLIEKVEEYEKELYLKDN